LNGLTILAQSVSFRSNGSFVVASTPEAKIHASSFVVIVAIVRNILYPLELLKRLVSSLLKSNQHLIAQRVLSAERSAPKIIIGRQRRFSAPNRKGGRSRSCVNRVMLAGIILSRQTFVTKIEA
jgi:hypothetical protein